MLFRGVSKIANTVDITIIYLRGMDYFEGDQINKYFLKKLHLVYNAMSHLNYIVIKFFIQCLSQRFMCVYLPCHCICMLQQPQRKSLRSYMDSKSYQHTAIYIVYNSVGLLQLFFKQSKKSSINK